MTWFGPTGVLVAVMAVTSLTSGPPTITTPSARELPPSYLPQFLSRAKQAAELNPKGLFPWVALGAGHLIEQNLSGARTALDRALMLGPDSEEAHYLMALLNHLEGIPPNRSSLGESAKSAFSQLIVEAPQPLNPDAVRKAVELLWVGGMPDTLIGGPRIFIEETPPPPPYPAEAKRKRIEGIAEIEILVGTDGRPTQVNYLSGPAVFRKTAVRYGLAYRFQPAYRFGVPQTARLRLTLPFELK